MTGRAMANSTEMNALGVEVPVACNSLYVENSVDRASAMQAKHASPVP